MKTGGSCGLSGCQNFIFQRERRAEEKPENRHGRRFEAGRKRTRIEETNGARSGMRRSGAHQCVRVIDEAEEED